MNFPGIYAIISKRGKWYIGSTSKTISKRIKRHFLDLQKNMHCNKELQATYNKYGKDYFECVVLEKIEDIANLLTREQYYIDTVGVCTKLYNQCPVAGSRAGSTLSPETKKKMSMSQLGKKRGPMTERTKALISQANKGKKPNNTPEICAKISLSLTGRKLSPERIAFLKSRTFTDEQRKRMSEGQKRRFSNPEERERVARQRTGTKASPRAIENLSKAKSNPSEETRRRLSAANKRRYQSGEERKKTGDAFRGKPRSEETKRKISEAKREYWRKKKEGV